MGEQKVRAVMIVEVAGRPPEYIKQSLMNHTAQLRKVNGVEVIEETIHEPKKLKTGNNVYTCFSEIEFETTNFLRLMEIIFDFMPSSIEILSPPELKLNIPEATSFVNTLAGRLHRYDEIAKIAKLQNQQLAKKLQEMQAELMKKKRTKKKKN